MAAKKKDPAIKKTDEDAGLATIQAGDLVITRDEYGNLVSCVDADGKKTDVPLEYRYLVN